MFSLTMNGSPVTGRSGFVALATALALGALPAVAHAQSTDARWLPWLGCWEPAATESGVSPSSDQASQASQASMVCLSERAGEAGVVVTSYLDGKVQSERVVTANGQRQPVDEAGCKGWETGTWSEDGQRVFLRSELDCGANVQRVTSGIIAMAGQFEWVDVQAVDAGGAYLPVRTRRYRAVDASRAASVGVQSVPADRALAVATARTSAAAPLDIEDVAEASQQVVPDVIEAFLIEEQAQFDLDANALEQLADAGVPGRVTDLMVALSNPDRFAVNEDSRAANPKVAEVDETTGRTVYADMYDPRAYAGWGYDPYGYRYGYGRYGYDPFFYSPFGYGGWGWGGGRYGSGGGVIIVTVPGDGDAVPAPEGRAIRGRGYTRGGRSSPAASSRTSTGSFPSRASTSRASTGRRAVPRGSSSGATVTKKSGSSSSGAAKASTGRTAKKRGSGSSSH